jgi:DNA invertase Pin-like site-specific DNA recombinase
VIKEFVEVESGKKSDRPILTDAIKACRLYGAKLVIAKIDRLSRDAHFLLGLEKAGIDFVAAPPGPRDSSGKRGVTAAVPPALGDPPVITLASR